VFSLWCEVKDKPEGIQIGVYKSSDKLRKPVSKTALVLCVQDLFKRSINSLGVRRKHSSFMNKVNREILMGN
jgi:hypothetical protein